MGDSKPSRPKLVYLAGPIDLVDKGTARDWRAQAAKKLQEYGFGVFSPAHAFELAGEVSRDTALAVLQINKAAMEQCGAILANLDGPGYGTAIELHVMHEAGVPAASFGGNPKSLYVKVWPHFKSQNKAIKSLVDRHARQ